MDKLREVDLKICAEVSQKWLSFNSSTIAHSSKHGFPTTSSTWLYHCFEVNFLTYPLSGLRYIISRLYKIKNIVNNNGIKFWSRWFPRAVLLFAQKSSKKGLAQNLGRNYSPLFDEKIAFAMRKAVSFFVQILIHLCLKFNGTSNAESHTQIVSRCPGLQLGNTHMRIQNQAIVDKLGEVDWSICVEVFKKLLCDISSTIAHNAKQYLPTRSLTWIRICFINIFFSYPQKGVCYIISRLYKIKNTVNNEESRKLGLQKADSDSHTLKNSHGNDSYLMFPWFPTIRKSHLSTERIRLCVFKKRLQGLSEHSIAGLVVSWFDYLFRFSDRAVPIEMSEFSYTEVSVGGNQIRKVLEKFHGKVESTRTTVDKIGEVDLKICAEIGKKLPLQNSFTFLHILEQSLQTASLTYITYCLLTLIMGYPQKGARYIISRLYKIKNLVNNNSCRPHTFAGKGYFRTDLVCPLSEDRMQTGRFSGMVWGMQQVIQQ